MAFLTNVLKNDEKYHVKLFAWDDTTVLAA